MHLLVPDLKTIIITTGWYARQILLLLMGTEDVDAVRPRSHAQAGFASSICS